MRIYCTKRKRGYTIPHKNSIEKFTMKKILLCIVISLSSSFLNAGDVINKAVISRIATSSDGWSDNFLLQFSEGTGICNNSVTFRRDKAINQEAFNRLYSTALMAFASGKKVRISK